MESARCREARMRPGRRAGGSAAAPTIVTVGCGHPSLALELAGIIAALSGARCVQCKIRSAVAGRTEG